MLPYTIYFDIGMIICLPCCLPRQYSSKSEPLPDLVYGLLFLLDVEVVLPTTESLRHSMLR